jgi:phosphoribosylanthranilate isomerase
MTKIKICGLKRPEDIRAVNAAKPDYCGFIIEVPKSSRNVSADRVRNLAEHLDSDICPVGVFVNAPLELPIRLLQEGVISIAQLHGQEDDDYIREVKNQTQKPVIKAFSVRTAQDIEYALKSPADYILLDQGSGGTGKSFDWSLIPDIERPFFLAGGLKADNLEEAVKKIHPYAVDLSSSLETDGVKDPEKIKEAVNIIRRSNEIYAGQDLL